MSQLVEWPIRDEWPTSVFTDPTGATLILIDEVGFAQARAEAAIARLRVAEAALKQYASFASSDGPLAIVGMPARDALLAIGPIPQEQL